MSEVKGKCIMLSDVAEVKKFVDKKLEDALAMV
jgi:hypothetical protein